jgi:cation diffusion facilitator CzcD-associated flavoprotein CzcO
MTRASKPESAAAERLPNHVHIAIIGSGFSGVGAAIKLDEAGHHDFVVLERGEDVGGTWHDNTYPGAACDVPSHLY